MTTDWCVTCKANKIGIILQEPDIDTLQGDWTRPNNNITDYLRANNRFGIPFNIIYSPKAPNGIPLPVILTKLDTLTAINLARGEIAKLTVTIDYLETNEQQTKL